jgi:hypothetical protein
MTTPEPLDPESAEPAEPYDDEDWEPWGPVTDWTDQDPVLPRPADVPCARPELCQWRPLADAAWILRCEAVGCGIEYDIAVLDDVGSAEASRHRPVRTIEPRGSVL